MKKFFVVVAVLMLLATVSFAQISTAQAADLNPMEKIKHFQLDVVRLVNQERAKVGLEPLQISGELSKSAYIRAREMPQKYSHTRPDGSEWFTVMDSGPIRGENLARGQTSAEQVMETWMNSKLHRENILFKDYKEIGVAYYHDPNSNKHYWVQHFRG